MPALERFRSNVGALVPEGEQAALAKRIGMAASLLHNYLSGAKDPGIKQMERIAMGLGVGVVDLIGGEPPKAPEPSIEQMKLDAIDGILGLDGDALQSVLDALKPFLNRPGKKNQRRATGP